MSLSRYISKLGSLLNSSGQIPTSGVQDGSITQVKLASNLAGTGPAFHVSTSYSNSLSAATNTAATGYGTPAYDTASCFNTSNGRFTPNVAGYYLFIAGFDCGAYSTGSGSWASGASVFKNGAAYGGIAGNVPVYGGNYFGSVQCPVLVYMNGTTDYVQNYLYSGVAVTNARANFQGILLKAA